MLRVPDSDLDFFPFLTRPMKDKIVRNKNIMVLNKFKHQMNKPGLFINLLYQNSQCFLALNMIDYIVWDALIKNASKMA